MESQRVDAKINHKVKTGGTKTQKIEKLKRKLDKKRRNSMSLKINMRLRSQRL